MVGSQRRPGFPIDNQVALAGRNRQAAAAIAHLDLALGDSLSEGIGASIESETAFVPLVHAALPPNVALLNLGKAGGSAMADAEAMGRLISLALRSGIPLMAIHKQLRGISSDRAVGLGPNKVLSVPDAIAIALYEWWQEKQGIQQELIRDPLAGGRPPAAEQVTAKAVTASEGTLAFIEAEDSARAFIGTCPDCGSQLEFAEGCVKCHVCGFSECG